MEMEEEDYEKEKLKRVLEEPPAGSLRRMRTRCFGILCVAQIVSSRKTVMRTM